jgi:hypothetical protein
VRKFFTEELPRDVLMEPHYASLGWLIVSFGEQERSRGISRYHKGLCPLNSRH